MTPPRPPSRKAPESAPPTFEAGLSRLTEIVDALEAGSLPLEEAILRFEEGAGLYKQCLARLDDARRRIEILVSATEARGGSGSDGGADSGPVTVPFEDEGEARP